MTMLRSCTLAGALLAVSAVSTPATGQAGSPQAVYLRLADGPPEAYPAMTAAMPQLASRAGMSLLASYGTGCGGCRYHATVFVLESPAWSAQVLATGLRSAFASPVRLAVYEDEAGAHLALANPQSLGRTIVSETFEQPAHDVVTALTEAVRGGFPGTPVIEPYGQVRDRGLIGKTMGIVAGGPFPSKVEEAARVKATPALSVTAVADAVAAAGATPTPRWELRLAYRYRLPGGEGEVLGFTGGAMESKSFSIVGAGKDRSRADYACPGLDHAPAYPLELVIGLEQGNVVVLYTDTMFRMKMYFEDAGTMKFAANMAMPGSIQDELRDRVDEALEHLLERSAAR